MRSATAKKIGRDKKYKDWIKTLPCAAFGRRPYSSPCRGEVEPHHAGRRGMSQTADDHTLVPLCSAHHDRRMPKSVHTLGVGFWEYHGLEKESVISQLRLAYEMNKEMV